MFEIFFAGVQQDLKLAVLPPLACALFRALFIWIYATEETRRASWRRYYHCFRYGFWWGMDWNAYAYLAPLVLVTIPSAVFLPLVAWGDRIRMVLILLYMAVLGIAFVGRLVYYYHFHDIYNQSMWTGRYAERGNLVDIFFNQNHGALLLIGLAVYMGATYYTAGALLAIPPVSPPHFASLTADMGMQIAIFLGSIAIFYWFRFGGTFRHRLKPEWDEVPAIVKDDIFLGKATVDDLVALEMVWKHPPNQAIGHTDEAAQEILKPLFPQGIAQGQNPLDAFWHTAQGARIKKPSHVFVLLGEGHAQSPFDPFYESLRIMEGSRAFRAAPGTIAWESFLSGGLISQPSLASLVLGIYDLGLELNEHADFRNGTVQTAFAVHMKRLGYRTTYWYGGSLAHGTMNHFIPATGFDRGYGGPDICGKDAPRTWLGVYDHLLLEKAADMIEQESGDAFHFIYTTSNHGPFTIPIEKYGFDASHIVDALPAHLRSDHALCRKLAVGWYADQALTRFIHRMRAAYPDSLFIVTGDHAIPMIPYAAGLVSRADQTLRELRLPSFALSHPDLKPEMFAQTKIGAHMNILPTLMELIAPAGFAYCSLFSSLTAPLDHVVTPYCWMTKTELGDYYERRAQQLAPSDAMPSWEQGVTRFQAEHDALCELTAWMVRHPALLRPAKSLLTAEGARC